MWTAQLNRRELYEFFLGSTKVVEGRVRQTSQVDAANSAEVALIWEQDPTKAFTFPALVIASESELQGLLANLVAAPQIPGPITSLTRMLSREETRQYFDEDVLPVNEATLPALAALAFAEATLHSNARVGLRQLSPLICKRTLSFAWARAIAVRSSPQSLLELPSRWLHVHSMLNDSQSSEAAHRTVDSIIGVLSLVAQLAAGMRPDNAPGALAFELMCGNRAEQERAWDRLSTQLERPIRIESLQLLAREERGAYLQNALRRLTTTRERNESEELAAACAFLATRLAPGSLEHMDVLRQAGRPDLLAWYALYAALQNPKEIMLLHAGLGLRVIRDVTRLEDRLARPTADIAYPELAIIERVGTESLGTKTGHASELQVELVPYVTSSFTFQQRNRLRPESQQSFDMESTADGPAIASLRARISRLAAELSRLAGEVPDTSAAYADSKRPRRKPG